jgi:hypothetical protein
MDNHTRFVNFQREQQEIVEALMSFRNGDITLADLFQFCQTFKPDVTLDQVIDAVANSK